MLVDVGNSFFFKIEDGRKSRGGSRRHNGKAVHAWLGRAACRTTNSGAREKHGAVPSAGGAVGWTGAARVCGRKTCICISFGKKFFLSNIHFKIHATGKRTAKIHEWSEG